ncbi:MAG: DUF4249 family protein [Bacteroidales bacterium]|nr:DUF4249 family protein [Bacteroidales bacterium]
MKISKLILILSLIVLGCKDEFILELDDFEPLIVVDGLITNEDGPYMLTISQSMPVNFLEKIPYENCIVTIIENTGITEILAEIEPGRYVSSENGIKGIIGNEYSISIYTPEGKEYHSDFQELKEAVDIDSVYAERDSLLHIDYIYGLPGYQFYVNTKETAIQENYFLWSMTETFEYDADQKLAYVDEARGGEFIYYNPTLDLLYTCWKTQKVNYIFTGTTSKLSIPQIIHQPIHFVGTDTKKLTKRYSVLVQQYTIGEKAYNYWQAIEKQNSNDNFFASTQPYTIRGNIENINDEKELVLGYFTVAPVSQKRIFVEKSRDPFYYITCVAITDPEGISDFKRTHHPPWYWTQVEDYLYGIFEGHCLDCRTDGGDLFKPEFWIDK